MKIVNFIKLFSLIVCCVLTSNLSGQPAAVRTFDSIPSVIPLQLGDTIPEVLWNIPLQVINHVKEEHLTTLNAYRGKLILLDFWATWCTSCIKAIQSHAGLAETFGDELALIPVSKQSDSLVRSFFQQPSMLDRRFYSVVQDQILSEYFPHRTVPHYIWISPSGVLQAFTGIDDVNLSNIRLAIRGLPFSTNSKVDIDRGEPLFINTSLIPSGGEINAYEMVYTGYVSGLPSMSSFGKYKGQANRVMLTNVTLHRSTRILLRKLWDRFSEKRIIYTGTDEREEKGSTEQFTIDLIDSDIGVEDLTRRALKRISDRSPFKHELRAVPRDCLVLYRQADTCSLSASELEHISMTRVVNWFDSICPASHWVINETGIKALNFPESHIKEIDLESAISSLKLYGIDVRREVRDIEFLFISRREYL